MSHDLFSDVVSPAVRVRSSSRVTILVSIVGHALIVAAVIIVPLLATSVLPDPATNALSFVPAAPVPPMAAMPEPPRATTAAPAVDRNAAPIEAPEGFKEEAPAPPAGEFVAGAVDLGGRASGGDFGSGLGTAVEVAPPPAPTPVPQKPLRIGGAIREPVRVRYVAPVYPQIAVSARIGGIVIVDAVIGPDGVVREARVVKSVPLLDRAAIDAVREWRYTPTTLNGVPVPVIMSVRVEFKLQ